MNNLNLNLEKCCGCSSCSDACPQHAIEMVENEKGFLIPQINEDLCVNCGLCVEICDFKKDKYSENNTTHAYSLVVNNKDVLEKSTSGGAFSVLSNAVFMQDGVVAGCVMEKDFTIHHVVTSDKTGRDKMRRSKYVQSDMSGIWQSMRKELETGRLVLFTGTPCQCAAVKSRFGNHYENLLVVDFLCHGVPNNKMFKEHVRFLEGKYNKKIFDYTFRDKRYGWNGTNNNVLTDKGWRSKWINQVSYQFFTSGLSLRDCCFGCPYRSQHRPSDITIADFWGIEKLTHKKNHTGVSLVLTHSPKGEALLECAKKDCVLVEYPFEKVESRIAISSAPKPKKYEQFWDIYGKNGYEGLVKVFFDNSYKNRIRYEIRKVSKKLKLS